MRMKEIFRIPRQKPPLTELPNSKCRLDYKKFHINELYDIVFYMIEDDKDFIIKEGEQMYNPCEHCICKTCAIAQINGGAEGCGNCNFCKKDNYLNRCTHCNEYYNPIKRGEKNEKE